MTREPSRRTIFAVAALIVGAAWVVYAGTFGVPFLLDDHEAIVENATIRHLGQLGAVLRPPDAGPTGGRPLLNLSFAANYAWSGLHVESYHVVNLCVHVLAGLALLGIVRRTLRLPACGATMNRAALPFAALVTALWTLHPLSTEAVTYVSQRAESLMGLCYLGTLYFFVRSIESKRPARAQALSIAACCCGMAVKEVMMTAPVLVWLYDGALVSGSLRGALARRRGYFAGLAATWLLLGGLMIGSHIFSQRSVGFARGVSAANYALMESKVVAKYAGLAAWPSPLVFDYGPEISTSDAAPWVLLCVGAVAGAVWLWRRSKPLGFSVVAFFILLSPTSSVVPIAYQPMAESRMYLPLAAIVTLLVIGGYAMVGRRGLVAFGCVAVGLATLTAQRNHDYRTAIALWSDSIAKHPATWRGHYHLALELSRLPDRSAEAVAHFERAVHDLPDWAEARRALANQLAQIPTRVPDAIAQYEQALRLQPDYADAHSDFANLLATLPGRMPEAIAHYERALQLQPHHAEAHYNLANKLANLPGRAPEAIAHYEQAIASDPTLAGAHNNLAIAYAHAGRMDDALREFERAVALDPTDASARSNLERLKASRK